jgi:hypothetical protein
VVVPPGIKKLSKPEKRAQKPAQAVEA